MRSMLWRIGLLIVLVCGLALPMVEVASAQAPTADPPDVLTTDNSTAIRKDIEEARTKVTAFDIDQQTQGADDDDLVRLQVEYQDIAEAMGGIIADLQPRLDSVGERQAALGDPPGDNDPPEPASLADERKRLASERAAITALVSDATGVSQRADAIVSALTEYRRELFARTLLMRTDMSFEQTRQVQVAVGYELHELQLQFSGWLTSTLKNNPSALATALALSLASAALLIFGEYLFAKRFMSYQRAEEAPSAYRKYIWAFWSTLLPTLAVVIVLELTAFFLDSFGLLTASIEEILSAFIEAIVIVFFVARLAAVVLAPRRPNWRLIRISNSGANLLWWLIFAMALVNALDYFADNISETLNSPFVLTVARGFVAAVTTGFILIAAAFVRPILDDEGSSRPWPRWFAVTLIVLGIALIVLPLAGYVGLARFTATQIIILGAMVVTMHLGFRAANAISEPDSFVASPLGMLLSKRLKFGQGAVEQLGVVVGITLYIFVLALGLPLIFLIWGFQVNDIQNWVREHLTSFTIGNVTISLSGIFFGLLMFVVGYFATRWLQKWLDDRVLRRGRVDAGLSNSIRTGIGYLGVGIAAVIGATVAGINLSNLALVAGALSVGIGFGLQNIVNNFVSGLILLAERPFKVGDWVQTASTQGFVRHISVRATEIETFQRQSIIVPNSELINSPVGNWTHRSSLGRVDIAIGVSYGSDPRRVMELLEEIGYSNDLVLREPPIFVVFKDFGESSLDFELRVFLPNILSVLAVGTDLRLKIFERFKEEGIEIPFPQRDLHIKMPKGVDATAVETAKKALQDAASSQEAAPSQTPAPGMAVLKRSGGDDTGTE